VSSVSIQTRTLLSVLFFADVLHPIDDLAVQPLLNRDVRHGGCRCRAVPVFLSRREPDYIAGMNFLDGATISLHPSAACGDNQGLSKGMRMPRGARARFKRDAGTGNQRWIGRLKQRVDTDCAGKPICRTFARGLRTDAFDFHTFDFREIPYVGMPQCGKKQSLHSRSTLLRIRMAAPNASFLKVRHRNREYFSTAYFSQVVSQAG
jgi:hypothetical protein